VAQEDLNQNKDLQPVLAVGSAAGEAASTESLGSHAAALAENIRFGVDGKPIPQWIVTMQQLDKKFPCEVCGGTVYDGPKNYSEHFRAERHIGALARLGVVQNLRLFDHVDKIREVMQLRDRLEGHTVGSSRRRMREDELSEEMQDVQGNVMTNRHFRQYQDRRNTL
jgi:splicing factor 3A subunit 3